MHIKFTSLIHCCYLTSHKRTLKVHHTNVRLDLVQLVRPGCNKTRLQGLSLYQEKIQQMSLEFL